MRKFALFMVATFALSASAAQYGNLSRGQYFRLFAPLTFYHSVAGNQLSIASSDPDEVSQAIDQALMHVYLKRPDLIQVTQTEQEKSGGLRQDIIEKSVVKQEVEMVEQAEPMPDMPSAEPVEVVIEKPNFWKYKADTYLQFMQNYVSGNWYKGGESNYSMVGALTLEANYDNKNKWKWDNKLELKLGFLRSRTDTLHKVKSNEDLIRFTSKVGLQATKHWYYTLQLQAYTQFSKGYKSNDPKVYSDWFSPFNLNLGLGMDYKVETENKRLTGTVNLSPIAVNYRYVGRLDLGPSYGLDPGKHSMVEFGPNMTADLVWKFNDVVTWKTRFYAFTSFKRAEIEWENTFELRVSKYITANLFLFPRFDDASIYDDDLGFWQFKEYSSLGFAYTF